MYHQKILKRAIVLGVSKNNSKKTIIRFANRKHAKKALISRKNLRKSSSPNSNVFINENLTIKNNETAFLSRKLKRSGHITKTYTRDGTVHISSREINRRKILTIHHIYDLLIFSHTMILERIIGKMIKIILFKQSLIHFVTKLL